MLVFDICISSLTLLIILTSISCAPSSSNGHVIYIKAVNLHRNSKIGAKACFTTEADEHCSSAGKTIWLRGSRPELLDYSFDSAKEFYFFFNVIKTTFSGETTTTSCKYNLNSMVRRVFNGANISEDDWVTLNASSGCSSAISVRLQAVIQCSKYHYGTFCSTECVPNQMYSCSLNGTRICSKGWNNHDCETYIGPCASHKCDPTCTVTLIKDECRCISDTPPIRECVPDICSNITCLNGGTCDPQMQLMPQENVTCSCTEGFYGPMCQFASSTAADFSTSPPPTSQPETFLTATITLSVVLSFAAFLVFALLCSRRCRRQIPSKPPSPEVIHLRPRSVVSGVYEDPEVSPYTDFDSSFGSDFSVSSEHKDEDDYHIPGPVYTLRELQNEPLSPPRLPGAPSVQPIAHFVRR